MTNFESWTGNVSLTLNENFNVITGSTGQGKSGILRAINWVLLNKPAGSAMVTKGKKETSVALVFDNNGKEITVKKTRKSNKTHYEIDDRKIEAVGQAVPQDIVDLIPIREYNLQGTMGQFESPYLVGDTPGVIAQKISESVDLGVVRDSISYVQEKKKKNASEIKQTEEKIKNIESDLESFPQLEKIEKTIERADANQQEVEKKKAAHVQRAKQVKALQETEKELMELPPVSELSQKHNKLLEKVQKIRRLNEKTRKAHSVLSNVKKESKSLCKIDEIIQKTGDLSSKNARMITTITTQRKRKDTIKHSYEKLKEALHNYKTVSKQVKDSENEIKEITKGKCPICGGVL